MVGFLTIPLELRNRIYEIILSSTTVGALLWSRSQPIRQASDSNQMWQRLEEDWAFYSRVKNARLEKSAIEVNLPIVLVCRRITSEIKSNSSLLSNINISIVGQTPSEHWAMLPVAVLDLTRLYWNRFEHIKPKKVRITFDGLRSLFSAINEGAYPDLISIISSNRRPPSDYNGTPTPATIITVMDETYSFLLSQAFDMPEWRFSLLLQWNMLDDQVSTLVLKSNYYYMLTCLGLHRRGQAR